MIKYILLFLLFFTTQANSQDNPVKIVDEEIRNRLALYAVNESETDYDVLLTVSGTGFKQRAGKPRWMFVPSASKVLINTLIIERGKRVNYTYEIQINDSLSRRSLKKPTEPVKIKPKKPITVFITKDCRTCDTLIKKLEQGKYQYKTHILSEKPEIREQIDRVLSQSKIPLDSLKTPIISLAGKLYTQIEDHDGLIEAMNEEE
jgi:arsenate reductase-like glutaredoxin family protein